MPKLLIWFLLYIYMPLPPCLQCLEESFSHAGAHCIIHAVSRNENRIISFSNDNCCGGSGKYVEWGSASV